MEKNLDHLDDFPSRDSNHKIQELAETAFRDSVSECGFFLIQNEDRHDYGTDFHLEIINNESMTNIRIHVQVKGTNAKASSKGLISRSVARRNLNYLLQQPYSIYVCYHVPTKCLYARFVDDVYREYEHQGDGWRTQKSITVYFTQPFNCDFQKNLKDRCSVLAKLYRDERVSFSITPPDQLTTLLRKTTERVFVPANYDQAKAMINELYNSGKDQIISNSFDLFSVELSSYPKDMMLAYMAEINLGIDGCEIDRGRVESGIKEIQNIISSGLFEVGSLLYSIGNGWLALKKYENARDVYNRALIELDRPELADVAAQCCKNMGHVLAHLSKDENVPIAFYQRALDLSPGLSEAHFALALCYRNKQDFTKVIEHLDQVVFINRSHAHNSSLQGWRIEALFNNGDTDGAFREINSLLSNAILPDWAWRWCASLVGVFGRDSAVSAKKAIAFWDIFLSSQPESVPAKKERLLCLLCIKFNGVEVGVDFLSFKTQVLDIINYDDGDVAFWWDRIGHWAQCENDWKNAETSYRRAYELEPELYGYCFGTALNYLGKFEEAFPILQAQAENHLPDAQSWFQVAISCEGIKDVASCIFAYNKAISLDPDYDLAWFNLGGIYWNLGVDEEAVRIWKEAIQRFPDHKLAEDLRRNFSNFFAK